MGCMKERVYRLNFLGKEIEILYPRFCFGIDDYSTEDINIRLGSIIDFENTVQNISIAEFSELLIFSGNKPMDEDFAQKDILAQLILHYIFERGINVEEHSWKRGIKTRDGIRREGKNFILFKDVDNEKIENIYEATYDTVEGCKIKKGAIIENEKFNMERLFRKYDYKEIYTLKQLDKSNPDFVESLFGKEFEELSRSIQKAEFILPPDWTNREDKDWGWRETDIWQLSMDISIDFNRKNTSSIENFENLKLRKITIFPSLADRGVEFPVRKTK